MDFQTVITTVVTSGIVSGLVALGMQTYLKGTINHHFSKRIEAFKEQITVQAEQRKMDFDRKIHDFSLYSTKRHEIYPELFQQLHKLHYDLKLVQDIANNCRPFSNYMDVVEEFEKFGFSLSDKKNIARLNRIYEVTEEFSSIRQEEIAFLLLAQMTVQLDERLKIAKDFFLKNTIYFSDEAIGKITFFLEGLYILIHSQIEFYSKIETEFQDTNDISEQELLANLDKSVEEVKYILRNELSVGDYS